MWIHTTKGFVSIVQHDDDADILIVRARCEADIKAFIDLLEVPVEHWCLQRSDYAWRCYVGRIAATKAIARAVSEIDYGNFKSAAATTLNPRRVGLLHRVWSVFLGIEADDRDPEGVEPDRLGGTWLDDEDDLDWPGTDTTLWSADLLAEADLPPV